MDRVRDLFESGLVKDCHIVSLHVPNPHGFGPPVKIVTGNWFDDHILKYLHRTYSKCEMDEVGWDVYLEDLEE